MSIGAVQRCVQWCCAGRVGGVCDGVVKMIRTVCVMVVGDKDGVCKRMVSLNYALVTEENNGKYQY